MIDPSTRKAVQESWALVRPRSASLTQRFYERVFEAAPAVRPLFPEDLRDQRRKLARTLDHLVAGLGNLSTVILDLTELAERHVAYGTQPAHYPVVGEALVGALRDELGEAFTAEHEAAWVETYTLISGVMINAQAAVTA